MNELKWITKLDARTTHISKNEISSMLIFPSTKAELTIYWFCHGRKFYSYSGRNCRCVAVNINES